MSRGRFINISQLVTDRWTELSLNATRHFLYALSSVLAGHSTRASISSLRSPFTLTRPVTTQCRHCIPSVFAATCAAFAVMRCLCVCSSVCLSRSYILSKRIYISSKFFSPSGSPTILVFLYQTAWQYLDENALNGGLECRWGRLKYRFSTNICDH